MREKWVVLSRPTLDARLIHSQIALAHSRNVWPTNLLVHGPIMHILRAAFVTRSQVSLNALQYDGEREREGR